MIAKLTKSEQAAKIEAAITAARAVAATPEAKALARRTGGKFGVYRLRDGEA